MYLTQQLSRVGITASNPRRVIEQAMQIGSGKALETAISVCVTGIGWAVKMHMYDAPHSAITEEQRKAIHMFINLPEVQEAKYKLRQIQHEAC